MWKWCEKSELLSRCSFLKQWQFVISDQSVTSTRSLRDFSWESVFAAHTCDCSSTLTCTGFVAALCACKCAPISKACSGSRWQDTRGIFRIAVAPPPVFICMCDHVEHPRFLHRIHSCHNKPLFLFASNSTERNPSCVLTVPELCVSTCVCVVVFVVCMSGCWQLQQLVKWVCVRLVVIV